MADNRQVVTISSQPFFMKPLPAYSWNPTSEGILPKLLKSPGNSSPEGASHPGSCCVDKFRNKLRVLVIQQVLPANGELQACNWPPAEVSIQRVVAGYVEARKVVHISKSHVLLKMLRQV